MKKIFSNKRLVFTAFSIALVLIILIGTTYSVFFKIENLPNAVSYTSGILNITSQSQTGTIELSSMLPMDDSDGELTEPYIFRVSNNGNVAYKFDIKLLITTTENVVSSNCIRIMIDDNQPVTLSDLTNGLIKPNVYLDKGQYIDISVRVWLSKANTRNTEIGKSFAASIVTDGIAVEHGQSADQMATSLSASPATTTVYKVDHPSTTNVPGTEHNVAYRYRGKSPNGDKAINYVLFNDELWNIFGWFYVETPVYTNGTITSYNWELRMKIVRNTSIGNMQFNPTDNSDFDASSLNTYLNSTYYNSLTEEARSFIGPAKYYIGGFAAYTAASNNASGIYSDERGTYVYRTHATTSTTTIAVPYASDIGYSASSYGGSDCSTVALYNFNQGCADTSWLTYEVSFWAIDAPGIVGNLVGIVTDDGQATTKFPSSTNIGVKPTLYLKSNVGIYEGDGTITHPYKLKIIE